jgi:stage II sporulation protein AA (anti-sigma F factor antagonist)
VSGLVSLAFDRDAETVRAELRGEIDASNADEVRSELEDAISERALVIDLSRLDYLDSAGIRALFAVSESASVRGCRCSIVIRETSPVRRILDVAGVAAAFELVEPTSS